MHIYLQGCIPVPESAQEPVAAVALPVTSILHSLPSMPHIRLLWVHRAVLSDICITSAAHQPAVDKMLCTMRKPFPTSDCLTPRHWSACLAPQRDSQELRQSQSQNCSSEQLAKAPHRRSVCTFCEALYDPR